MTFEALFCNFSRPVRLIFEQAACSDKHQDNLLTRIKKLNWLLLNQLQQQIAFYTSG